MKIIIGLGNPLLKPEKSRGGPRVTFTEYKGTRHNVGQAIVSYFQEVNNFPKFQLKKKLESLISEGKIGEEKIILALPQTFMNESGRAVQKIILNLKPCLPAGRSQILNLLVIHDDIDLPLGTIRIKKDGSSGGHKGVQSIIDHLKTQNFTRIKIGIRPQINADQISADPRGRNQRRSALLQIEKFVLERFGKEEKEIISRVIKKGAEIINNFLDKSFAQQTFSL